MGCVEVTFPALPSLGPLSLTPPALPPVDVSVDFCCKIQLISFAGYAPLGPAVLAIPGASAVVLFINQQLALVDKYIDAIPLKCPRSGS